MRLLLFIGAFFVVLSSTMAQSNYQLKIQHDRDSINIVFGDSETSILNPKDLKGFKEIPYYPIDEKYRVKCTFRAILDGKVFDMKTTTSRLSKYKPYGELIFTFEGATHRLVVYQSANHDSETGYEDYLFVPFTDQSSGDSSYGGGRYLDFRIGDLASADFYLDFNTCYNPYCAYNSKYSCPIPPQENFLDIAILAGAKKWHK